MGVTGIWRGGGVTLFNICNKVSKSISGWQLNTVWPYRSLLSSTVLLLSLSETKVNLSGLLWTAHFNLHCVADIAISTAPRSRRKKNHLTNVLFFPWKQRNKNLCKSWVETVSSQFALIYARSQHQHRSMLVMVGHHNGSPPHELMLVEAFQGSWALC